MVRSAVCRLRVKGAGLLRTEPKESRPVFWSKLKADAAIDHRYGIRVQGEGCEGVQVSGFEEVDLHLRATGVIQGDCGIRYI